MQVSQSSLAKLSTAYRGYLKGERISRLFTEFGIKFAAGHWAAGDFSDRFAPAGYFSRDKTFEPGIIGQIKRVAAAGIEGIEFHEQVFINDKYRKDPEKIKTVKSALKKYRVVPTNMNTNLFSDPKWKLGGITNANKQIRKEALALTLQGIDIAIEIGCKSVSLWPGSDGWDYNFEVNYGKILDWFIEGCIAINKKAKANGLKFGIEAKLKEPREGNMVVPTTHLAALVAKKVNEVCGGKNMGVAIDYGHEQMYGVEPGSMLYTVKRFGVPVTNFHLNNAKYHSNDEDRITGTGDNWKLADFCYAAIDTGYAGWFGEDQYTYRIEPTKAMALSREFFANIMKKALQIYAKKAELEKAQATGNAAATIDVVKEILI
ncbi:MAG: sugar phosphate isomerase/epimerase family protein [bacterium]|nr:sugar phosphate isomerase/epimerase family protein [bacterium]